MSFVRLFACSRSWYIFFCITGISGSFRTTQIFFGINIMCFNNMPFVGFVSAYDGIGCHARQLLHEPKKSKNRLFSTTKFVFIKLWSKIVMIKDVFNTKYFKNNRQNEEMIRRICAMNNVKSFFDKNANAEDEFPKNGVRVFNNLIELAPTTFIHRVSVYLYSMHHFMIFWIFFTNR